MKFRFRATTRVAALTLLVGLLAGGCYKDDVTGLPSGGKPLAKILLTDSPFPFDSVASVNVYVVSIEASASADSSGSQTATGASDWVTIAAPHRSFNLLTLQQGTTAFVGQGELSAGHYRAVRMTIDTDSSSIIWSSGGSAQINWSTSGRLTMYALVQSPVSVDSVAGPSSVNIVLDFDVGRSFPYNLFGNNEFDFIPWLRAVNSATTGTVEGTVTTPTIEGDQPMANADITVYPPDAQYQTFAAVNAVATGHTDVNGHYRVAFLSPGQYFVRAEAPRSPLLAPASAIVNVTTGGTAQQNFSLVSGNSGGAYIHITGPGTVGVGGAVELLVAVTDSNGQQVTNPTVVWTTSDSSVATVQDSIPGNGGFVLVTGLKAGIATITAMSQGLTDAVTIQVIGSAGSVTSITIDPPTVNVAVGDSIGFYATLRDTLGTQLFNLPISWTVSDSTVVRLFGFGPSALIQPLRAGTVSIQAMSGGRTGTASVTVH
jgi:hypothetical protein